MGLAIAPAQATQIASTPSFVDQCEQRHTADIDTEITISALLNAIGTEDCQMAHHRLQSVTALYSPSDADYEAIHSARLSTGKSPFIADPLIADLSTLVDLDLLVALMPHLRQLALPNAVIRDATPLRQLSHLEVLILSETTLETVEPLAALANLIWLDLRGNFIRDLSPLAELRHLEHLDVRENYIRDFRVLSALPPLFSVRLRGNPIDTSTCLGRWADACEIE